LRTASVVAEGDEQRLPLRCALGSPAVELLKLIAHAFEPEALLVDLAIEPAALRGRAAENGEEAGALATDAPGLRHQAVDLELLAIDHVFRAPNLIGARRVCIALVEGRQLGLKPLTSGVCGLCIGCR
jgi:hypothetical protein